MQGIFRSELECILTDPEAKTYSNELARLTQQQAELEDRKKEVGAEYKAKIDACISQTRVIARKVATGKEMRDVEVRWEFDFPANCKHLLRLDTYQVVDTRPLNDKERQLRLDLEQKANEEEPEPVEVDGEELENPEQPPVEHVALGEEIDDSEELHQPGGLCVLKDTPCTGCDKCQQLEESEEIETVEEPPPFECQDCRKKKKARICGADCRQV